jgi:hypothetical protein
MAIREIAEEDLPAVVALLAEGFPSRRSVYWRRGFENMRALPALPGYPRYGYLLEEDGAVQGLILLLSTRNADGIPRANLTAWYVRAAYRSKAVFLYKLAIRQNGGLHLNLSPSAHVLPIVERFGFKPYTGGVCLLDARAALRPARGWRLTRYEPGRGCGLSAAAEELAARHHDYGCTVLILHSGAAAPELIIYRVKWIKGLIPCAQMLLGAPGQVLSAAGPLMRHLLGRAIPLALVDISEDTESAGARRYPGRNVRYVKGPAPAVGDMTDSELALFGP